MAGAILHIGGGASTGSAAVRALSPGETGRVASVVDGDTLFLDNGLKVRLSGIQAPKLPLGREGFKAWPLGEAAKAELEAIIDGKDLRLYYGGQKRDRYDRALAQTFLLDDKGRPSLWVQEAMVERGMARVYTWPDTWQDSKRLYQAEEVARRAKRGIWALPFYRVRRPDANALAQDIDSFQLVSGIIVSSATIRGTTYLNFGADYRTDFTIKIVEEDEKRFKGWDFKTLEGARVRVRGWVEMDNGPMIRITHPEQLEILD